MRKLQLTTILLLLTALVQIFSATAAFAHGEGGVLQIGDRVVGPYLLHAWTSPGIPRLGETHFEALITNRDGKPVDDCKVVMVVTSQSDETTQRINTTEPLAANQYRHEGVAMLTTPGSYTVDIIVSENGLQIGQSSFGIKVPPPSLWLKVGLNGILGCLGLVGLWFLRQGINLMKYA